MHQAGAFFVDPAAIHGVDQKTVGAARRSVEEYSSPERIGRDGKSYSIRQRLMDLGTNRRRRNRLCASDLTTAQPVESERKQNGLSAPLGPF